MDGAFQGLDNLSFADRHVFNKFSRGASIRPLFSLVHKAFEDIVDKEPHCTAVEHDGDALTYQQLDRSANRLAGKLIRDGLKPGQKVCLVVQRSVHMVIAILAVLKCGCQYIPLDGGVIPDNLLKHILVNTEAQFVLCLEKLRTKAQRCSSHASIVVLDSPSEVAVTDSAARPNIDAVPSDGAYVIYTSGML